MGLNQINSLGEYTKFLRQNTTEVSALSDDLMIHVTGFFRDPESWDALMKKIIEPLVAERDADAPIRCWVTACSSGEEAYTLSMLLTEAAEAAGKMFDIKVFATDTADRTLARARLGVYPMGIEAEIAPARLERFFDQDDATYRVKKELRELVVFAPQNVIQDPPFSRLDICTCRNLLIYLEPQLQHRVLSLLHFGLRDGGTLFLGSSETVNGADDLFEIIDKRARIFRRIGPVRQEALEFAFPGAIGADGGGRIAHPAKPTIGQITNRLLLDEHTPAAVAVDRNHRVVYLHGETEPYLSLPQGEPTRELFLLVRENLRGALRMALHKAAVEGTTASSLGPPVEFEGRRYRVEVTVTSLDVKQAAGHYLITFRKRDESAIAEAGGDVLVSEDAVQLQRELRRTQDELRSTIEELQASNEELKAANEEAMSVNEELQSTNEELLTSKEELQSLNEELTTVNMQLQTKMEEHEQTSNDLSSLLSSTDIAVIFLDTKMRIRRFTPAITRLMELIPSDIGRPISDMARKFSDRELIQDAQTVLDRLIPIEREITAADGEIFVRRALPYRTSDNRIDGVVITFMPITDRKRAELALRETEERFRLMIENARDFAMLLMDAKGRIIAWNVGAERLLGWSADEAIGRSAAMIYPTETGSTQFQREMDRAAEFGRAADETWYVRKAGSRFWGSGVLTAVRNAEGELTGFAKVLRDDTARKQAENDRVKLLETERMAREVAENATKLKDHFLATLSHELRTPLSAVLVWAKMLRQNLCEPEEREEGLAVIERSAEAQKKLLDDLLDTSRIAAGKVRLERSDADLRAIVQSAVDEITPQAKEKAVRVKSHLATDIGLILADPHRLTQVVSNLLGNSVKFTPSGGSIDVHRSKSDGWIELSVADTGRGIEPEFLSQVFTAFSQAESTSSCSGGARAWPGNLQGARRAARRHDSRRKQGRGSGRHVYRAIAVDGVAKECETKTGGAGERFGHLRPHPRREGLVGGRRSANAGRPREAAYQVGGPGIGRGDRRGRPEIVREIPAGCDCQRHRPARAGWLRVVATDSPARAGRQRTGDAGNRADGVCVGQGPPTGPRRRLP
jgi:two-component system CheB/CheR fusion protein